MKAIGDAEVVSRGTSVGMVKSQQKVRGLVGIAKHKSTQQIGSAQKVVKKKASKAKNSKVKDANNDGKGDNIEESVNSDEKSIETDDDTKSSELKKDEVSENLSNDKEIKTEPETAEEKVSKASEKEASEEDKK